MRPTRLKDELKPPLPHPKGAPNAEQLKSPPPDATGQSDGGSYRLGVVACVSFKRRITAANTNEGQVLPGVSRFESEIGAIGGWPSDCSRIRSIY